tara:strand:+ start:94355 stop:94660 length:306 start_codon:yes stop_codon:yes gene_type:complete
MIMKPIRLVITFYKSYAVTSLLITISCLTILYTWGGNTFTALFWFKVFTLGLIYFYINASNKNVFYYYKNLGLTKKRLWISTLSFDLLLFLALSILTGYLK